MFEIYLSYSIKVVQSTQHGHVHRDKYIYVKRWIVWIFFFAYFCKGYLLLSEVHGVSNTFISNVYKSNKKGRLELGEYIAIDLLAVNFCVSICLNNGSVRVPKFLYCIITNPVLTAIDGKGKHNQAGQFIKLSNNGGIVWTATKALTLISVLLRKQTFHPISFALRYRTATCGNVLAFP